MGTITRRRSAKIVQTLDGGQRYDVSSSTFTLSPMLVYSYEPTEFPAPLKKKRKYLGKVCCAVYSYSITDPQYGYMAYLQTECGNISASNILSNNYYHIWRDEPRSGQVRPCGAYCSVTLYSHVSLYPPYIEDTYEDIILTPINCSPSSFADSSKSTVFSWDYDKTDIVGEDGLERVQKSAVIEWRGADQRTHTVNVSGVSSSYTFPENTFPKSSSFEWRVKIISDDDVDSGFCSWITVSTVDSAGTVRALSPDNAIVDIDAVNRFSWIYQNPFSTEQSGYEIEISSNGGESWRQIKKETTNNCFADIPAGTLPAGKIRYRVRAYSQSGFVSEWAIANITVRSHPPAPSIYRIDAASDRPTVYWESNDQEAFELKILDASGKTVYSHYAALPDRQHKIAKRLDNAQYTALVRTWNSYGLDSPDAIRQFSIAASKPSSPVIMGTAHATHNSLSFLQTTSRAVLMRNGIAVADVSGLDSYDDYTAPAISEYCLRALSDTAFRDSSPPLTLTFPKRHASMVLAEDHSVRVPFIYRQGSIPERSSSLSTDYSLLNFAGRKYPVAEYGDQTVYSKSLSYSLRNPADLEALRSMAGKTVVWNDRQDHMVACLSGLGWTAQRGYFDVSFTLTEIDGKEEIDYD